MIFIEVSQKVDPVTTEDKKINYVNRLMKKLRWLIVLELLIGVNRVFLLRWNRLKQFLSYIYTVTYITVFVYNAYIWEYEALSQVVLKFFFAVINTILIVLFIIYGKNSLLSYFELIAEFDEKFKIEGYLDFINPSKKNIWWAVACVLVNILQVCLRATFYKLEPLSIIIFLSVLVYDFELLFLSCLLWIIYTRLSLIAAHVDKLFKDDFVHNIGNKHRIEWKLSPEVELDVSSLHKEYKKLLKCASFVNTTFKYPIMLCLIAYGIHSIFLLRFTLVTIITKDLQLIYKVTPVIQILFRYAKSLVIVTIPCYYASITSTLVSSMRTTLHDAILYKVMDKVVRRKLKAFYYLTKECSFEYNVGSVFKLNMVLILSYIDACITYIIIIIQFSKFLD